MTEKVITVWNDCAKSFIAEYTDPAGGSKESIQETENIVDPDNIDKSGDIKNPFEKRENDVKCGDSVESDEVIENPFEKAENDEYLAEKKREVQEKLNKLKRKVEIREEKVKRYEILEKMMLEISERRNIEQRKLSKLSFMHVKNGVKKVTFSKDLQFFSYDPTQSVIENFYGSESKVPEYIPDSNELVSEDFAIIPGKTVDEHCGSVDINVTNEEVNNLERQVDTHIHAETSDTFENFDKADNSPVHKQDLGIKDLPSSEVESICGLAACKPDAHSDLDTVADKQKKVSKWKKMKKWFRENLDFHKKFSWKKRKSSKKN